MNASRGKYKSDKSFINREEDEIELITQIGHLKQFTKTQNGCRLLQRVLCSGKSVYYGMIFTEISELFSIIITGKNVLL